MIPAPVLGLLARFWPHIGAALLILGAVWFLDHRGYQRAQQEQALANARAAAQQSEIRRAIEQGLTTDMQEIEDRLSTRLGSIARSNTATQTIIEREVSRAPNLSSPNCTMPRSVRDALNATARSGGDPGTASERP